MKCVILSGGYGTRLRPLTLSIPKALVEFCNQPIVEYQVAAAKKAGVDHVILAVSECQTELINYVNYLREKYGIRVDCSIETSYLGTAGCIRMARDLIFDESDDCDDFFVLNSDIICRYPLSELLKSHQIKNATITILVTKVDNPSSFGVVLHDENYKITKFIEKPSEFVSDLINAGVYVLSKSVVDDIPLENVSIERTIFPKFAALGNTYCHPLAGYWSDIGTPSEYLRAQYLHLASKLPGDFDFYRSPSEGGFIFGADHCVLKIVDNGILFYMSNGSEASDADKSLYAHICQNVTFKGVCLVHPTAKIGPGSVIGPNVVIASNAVIGNCCRIIRSSIMKNVKIGDGAFIQRSIIGWDSHIGAWARIEGLSVFGKSVDVSDELVVRGCVVLPHKSITTSIYDQGNVIL